MSAASSVGLSVFQAEARCFHGRYGIILVSMPKAGTHLMLRILERATGRRGRRFKKGDDIASIDPRSALLYGHARYDQLSGVDRRKWRVVVMIRDPRDVVLSMLDFLPRSGKPRLKETYALIAELPRDEQLIALIDGIGSCASIARHCNGWIEWAGQGALIVRYEDVLDGNGLDKISDHLGIERRLIAEAKSAIAGNRTGAAASTLNKGEAWRWRSEMSGPVLDHFYRTAPNLLDYLGYENESMIGWV